jgi:hypothetical protein
VVGPGTLWAISDPSKDWRLKLRYERLSSSRQSLEPCRCNESCWQVPGDGQKDAASSSTAMGQER